MSNGQHKDALFLKMLRQEGPLMMTYLENGLLLPILMLEYLSSSVSLENTQSIQKWLADEEVERISYE